MFIKKILFSLLAFGMILSISGCEGKPEEERDVIVEDYGSVPAETAEVLVAKFNTNVVDNSTLNPASDDYLTTHENAYWYGLITGLYLIVYPKEFSGDLSKDIVDYMVIYVEKGSEFASDATKYLEYLIKANNPEITTDEINELVDQAKKTANDTTANNGKGIDIGYVEDEETIQYQVIRLS